MWCDGNQNARGARSLSCRVEASRAAHDALSHRAWQAEPAVQVRPAAKLRFRCQDFALQQLASEASSRHTRAGSTRGMSAIVETSSTCGSHLQQSKMIRRRSGTNCSGDRGSTVCHGNGDEASTRRDITRRATTETRTAPSTDVKSAGIAPTRDRRCRALRCRTPLPFEQSANGDERKQRPRDADERAHGVFRRLPVAEAATPAIRPHAMSHPLRRSPAASSLSMVTTSATPATRSNTSHESNNAPVAKPAENTTTHHPGPFPILPPAKHSVIARMDPRSWRRCYSPLDDVISRAETDPGKNPHHNAHPHGAEEKIEQEISHVVTHIITAQFSGRQPAPPARRAARNRGAIDQQRAFPVA